MNSSLKLTITWLFLVTSTLLSYFVFDLYWNGFFIAVLVLKKFLLIGFVYLEGLEAHWFYKIILIIAGSSLLIAHFFWKMPRVCVL